MIWIYGDCTITNYYIQRENWFVLFVVVFMMRKLVCFIRGCVHDEMHPWFFMEVATGKRFHRKCARGIESGDFCQFVCTKQ